MGDRDWSFAGDPPAALADEQGDKKADYDGRQGLAISRQHHPVLKLQDGRQEEIIMGDKDWRFPGIPAANLKARS